MLYIAANDGMLHALNGDTGDEVWAYIPRIVMPKLHKLATDNWGGTHFFTVDGSPTTMDVYLGGAWKTILVAGLNSGGRGYYALDVTNPATPVVLWEICSDSTLCAVSDTDMGYTFGNPVIAKRKSDGKWVVFVTSGMNNVSPGTGKGILYVLDAATGAVLSKVNTNVGDTTTPSGFNHIAGFADNFDVDNTAKLIYGGDLNGNVWRIDTATATPGISKLAQLLDGGGKPQSITTRPELALIQGFPVVYVGTGRYLGIDDLVDPATLGLNYAYQQSLYAIKDKGTGGTYTNMRSANVVVNTLIDNGTTRTTSNNSVDWASKDGWYIDFNPGNTSPGERVNLDPQLVQGTLVVATNIPNNSACTVGGDSFIYQFDYLSGRYVSSAAGNVAGVKTTGEIKVGIDIFRLPSGVFKGVSTGASGNKSTFPINIGGGGGQARRISWRELMRK
jgi:type IV pilus assembly protein PilY1